jgi:hypothetical protein
VAPQWLVGATAQAARRDSSAEDRDYTRWQVALRLTWQLAVED